MADDDRGGDEARHREQDRRHDPDRPGRREIPEAPQWREIRA